MCMFPSESPILTVDRTVPQGVIPAVGGLGLTRPHLVGRPRAPLGLPPKLSGCDGVFSCAARDPGVVGYLERADGVTADGNGAHSLGRHGLISVVAESLGVNYKVGDREHQALATHGQRARQCSGRSTRGVWP
jgi:hypothetical protein